MVDKIKMFGRVVITADLYAQTGLHIGGSSAGMEIGGVDNPVIRDAVTDRPYIPGSSLKGKMRSQLEKQMGLVQNNTMGKGVRIHTCSKAEDYEQCELCRIFGVPGEVEASGPTRLIVRDAQMTDASAERLEKAHTDLAYTELKTEVSIDRVTSAASPRNIERVPAGTTFGPVEMVFTFYAPEDVDLFRRVIDGMLLVEDDYLGGSGSRGSGKVVFRSIKITGRSSNDYLTPIDLGEFKNLKEMIDGLDSMGLEKVVAI